MDPLSWTGIFKAVGEIFRPIADTIDNVHTSEEERLNAKAQLTAVQAEVAKKWMDLEFKFLDVQHKVIMAEASSESWLTRNWRPITMLAFVWVILSYTYGLVPPNLNESIMEWVVKGITIGLGGYTVGRSAEKVSKIVMSMKKPEG